MRIHHENLRRIKGTVDMKEPQQFKHLKKKMKKTQMMEGKCNTNVLAIFVFEIRIMLAARRFQALLDVVT